MLQLEEYYKEPEALKRKEILDAMTPEADEEETYAQLLRLFGKRYVLDRKSGRYADCFLRAWMELKLVAGNLDNFLGNKRNKKDAENALRMLCLNPADGFNENLLYREMCHVTARYIFSCTNDSNYSSLLLGLGRINNQRLKEKINRDLVLIGETVPERLGMEDEFRILKKAITDTKDCEI